MSEAPIYPIASALANALTDATGIRFYDLPLAPDRIQMAATRDAILILGHLLV